MSETHITARATGQAQASRLVRLRLSSLGTVIMLIVQFILGVIYNLYGTAPTSTKSIGLFSSPDLALHVILGILLVIAALGQLIRAITVRHPAVDLDVGGRAAGHPGRGLRRARLHRQRRQRRVPGHVAGLRGRAGQLRAPGLRAALVGVGGGVGVGGVGGWLDYVM